MPIAWHRLSHKELARELQTNLQSGLSKDAVSRRRLQYGANEFSERKRFRLVRIFLRQFASPLVLILLAAGVTAFALDARVDAIVIFLALVINVAVGVLQEGRASRAFERLRESQEEYAWVVRGGARREIPRSELVPGDIVLLFAGMSVPADARIIAANELLVNESALTGEWASVPKTPDKEDKDHPITEQANMAFMGTLVSSGTARAAVVSTGDETEIGKIAEHLKKEEEETTPLKRSFAHLARFLAFAVVAAVVLLALFGILRGADTGEMFLVAVALAVAVVPEGLPAAFTVVLALGMEKILRMQGLVRNLLAAETLGSTTIILTDKTGTLTEARMEVREVAAYTSVVSRGANGTDAEQGFEVRNEDERMTLALAVAASDAFVEKTGGGENGDAIVRGRPVERAVVRAGLLAGAGPEVALRGMPQTDAIPFSSDRQFAASIHVLEKGKTRATIVGAPELVLQKSAYVHKNGAAQKLDNELRKELLSFQEKRSRQGFRLVAVAYKDGTERTFPRAIAEGEAPLPHDFVFGGYIVLHDPIRAGVRTAIKTAQEAGVRVTMVTGDYAATAASVAEAVGIKHPEEEVHTGEHIEGLSDDELADLLARAPVFARVVPAQKLRIARLLKSRGAVVAMTGDGVNDAPALRTADIGVALGSGTDVAKEASDLVLLDDGFDIIVAAIREGRRIIDNLKKITSYLLSTGFSEIFVVGAAVVAGFPLPLLPAQILWINIIEEGLMNFAFAFEPAEKDVMERKPQSVKEGILTRSLKKLIVIVALVTGVFLIGLYFLLLSLRLPIEEIRTIMFVALSVDSIFFSLSLKNLHKPIWHISILSNKYLLFALAASLAVLFVALTLPPLQALLSLEPFSFTLFLALVGFGFFNLVVIEVVKYIVFRKESNGI